jgi:hypothetical protein
MKIRLNSADFAMHLHNRPEMKFKYLPAMDMIKARNTKM